MAWQSLKVRTDERHAERLSDALLELGALSAGIEDADAGTEREQPVFGEPGEPPPGVWRHSVVSALFPADADIAAVMAELDASLELGLGRDWSVEALEETDWVRLTQSQFDPIPISPRLWIVPSWHTAPDPGAINLQLDPGLAFGTGGHPTTRLCLQWLDEHIRGGETVLDYGCGSGILAIAAAKLGAGKTVGIDIDPQAILSSRQNAAMNGVEIDFFLPDEAPALLADIVIANILTNPLKVLAPLLAGSTRPGGRLVLSGILAPQAGDVLAVYRAWFDIDVYREDDGWVCLGGSRMDLGRDAKQQSD
ncbi:MAG: 50S ribosomal protein L11 methyltransferase [Sulfuricellaceae bacterium]|nr:50S ribosomal protein L11 methyltransferase [Sulfuricellaceae bacterium]